MKKLQDGFKMTLIERQHTQTTCKNNLFKCCKYHHTCSQNNIFLLILKFASCSNGLNSSWNCVFLSRYGLRNSLLVAPMPTASTAQILGNNESFEPYTSNIYTRRVLSGEFQVWSLQSKVFNDKAKHINLCNWMIMELPCVETF